MTEASRATDLVVLGAGRPTGAGIVGHPEQELPALRWIRQAVEGKVERCRFVAGFAAARRLPTLAGFAIDFNEQWETTGSAASLLCADVPEGRGVLASYADIVFREDIVSRLTQAGTDIALAMDTAWRQRYEGRTAEDMAVAEKVTLRDGALDRIGRSVSTDDAAGEFVGLVFLSPSLMTHIRAGDADIAGVLQKGSIADLVSALVRSGRFSVSLHDVQGDWAELNAPQDLSRFVLGTKAETLDRLRPLVRHSRVEDQVRFTVGEWTADATAQMARISDAFGTGTVIVRSSARSEDSWSTANAGAFESIANVPTDDRAALADAIDRVVHSYGPTNPADQVLVQPMLAGVVANGVVFTRTLSHGAPYFVINFDETLGSTDGVTAGRGNVRVLYVHHKAARLPDGAPSWMEQLVAACRELIGLVAYDSLDIEFAVSGQGEICLLQTRPIAVDHSGWSVDDGLLLTELKQAQRRYAGLAAPSGRIAPGAPLFGIMPDWNPAEIVGKRPGLLASSLYRYLICDETWARQRAEYGYHDVRPQPLLVAFAGQPYVNVRASFRSFVPAGVPGELADRLVDHYVARLVAEPALHDKVEFAIAFTCMSLDFEERAREQLLPAGFSVEDVAALRAGLVDVTREGMKRCEQDLATIADLERRHDELMARSLDPLERACALLEDCRRFGTLPFAHLARAGFVAVTLMRSAVRRGLIDQAFLDRYLGSISTVAKDFVRDSRSVEAKRMAWDDYVARYGHLRPGTYDILSPSYRDDDAYLLRQSLAGMSGASAEEIETIDWPQGAWEAVQAELAACGLETDRAAFDGFVRSAIEGREYAKFVFSRSLSQALDDIAAFGADEGVSREVLAGVPVETLLAMRAGESFGDPGAYLRAVAEFNAPRAMLSRNVELPPLIHSQDQFLSFFQPSSEPNYVTSGAVTAETCVVDQGSRMPAEQLKGRIVIIPAADPGFDWLFGCGIAGLITQYGGANSHMAIRAAEFGTPAAIGTGEILFEKLSHAHRISLDCLNRRIQVLQ